MGLIKILISIVLFVIILKWGIDKLLLRKARQAPEIERKLLAGEYGSLDAARAAFFLDYIEARGLYIQAHNLNKDDGAVNDG